MGDQLVVGLINDAEILRCKGPPVMNEEERGTLVESVKWVDEILRGASCGVQGSARGGVLVQCVHAWLCTCHGRAGLGVRSACGSPGDAGAAWGARAYPEEPRIRVCYGPGRRHGIVASPSSS